MKIAVCCQNGREVSAHPGKCTRFLLVDSGGLAAPQLLLLPAIAMLRQASLHGHPLAACQVILAAGGGQGLAQRLAAAGITLAQTQDREPLLAVAAWLAGQCQPVAQPGKQLCQALD